MQNGTQSELIEQIKQIKDNLIKRLEANPDSIYQVGESRHLNASLYQDEKLLSTGIAEVSKYHVLFCPDEPKQLDGALHSGAILKVSSGKIIPLLQSLESFHVSNHRFWFFEWQQTIS